MKHLATALLLGTMTAASAAAQEFADIPGLREGLTAIRLQAGALKPELTILTPSEADSHRLGHSPQTAQMNAAAAEPEVAQTPDISPYPVRGMDISNLEGDIDWTRVNGHGLSFVFMKATEGGDWVDKRFKTNWAGATSAGLLKGAYHFYNFCKPGGVQADNFIATVPREAGALPMVIDFEKSKSCTKMPTKKVFLKDFAIFVAKVKKAYGQTPFLYINLGIYDEYLAGASDGYKLWIADPDHTSPRMPSGTSWTFWQYSWHGTVSGISGGEVDLDVFDGDAQALAALAKPQAAPPLQAVRPKT